MFSFDLESKQDFLKNENFSKLTISVQKYIQLSLTTTQINFLFTFSYMNNQINVES